VDLTLADFEIGSDIPLLVNCMPSGKYLMEDFAYAGGVPAVLKELSARICARPTRFWAKDISSMPWAPNLQPRRDPPLRRSGEARRGPARLCAATSPPMAPS
jgi:hypothetical protein